MDAQTFTISEQGGPCHFNPSDFTCAICRPGKSKFKLQYPIYLNVKIEKAKYLSSFFSVFQEITSVGLILHPSGMTLPMGNIAYLPMRKIFVGVAVSIF